MLEGKGETAEVVEQRIIPFLNSVSQTDEDSVLIVTHAFSASILAQIIMNIPRTFPNIQPLSTADYSHFRIGKGGENTVNVLSIQRNCLKGALSI
jgi:broad specificity phosphatase PhoE